MSREIGAAEARVVDLQGMKLRDLRAELGAAEAEIRRLRLALGEAQGVIASLRRIRDSDRARMRRLAVEQVEGQPHGGRADLGPGGIMSVRA